MGFLCAISLADFRFRFSRYNIRIAFNRDGFVRLYLGKAVIIVHRTFHNAVLIIGLTAVSIDLVLIQTAKDILPAIFIFGGNGKIVFRAVSRVLYQCPFFFTCQAALELDVDLSRLVRSAKIVLTICIFPELIELNVDQCALGVGKDCGNFQFVRIVRIFALHNLAFHHGVVDHMGGLTLRNGYALQFGTINGATIGALDFPDFLDGIAGANGDAGDGSGVVAIFAHFDFNILFDGLCCFQTLTANIIKGNFELVGSGQVFAVCGPLFDFQPAGFDGVDVFYL